MTRTRGYTAGKTRDFKKVPLPDEILKWITLDAVEQDKTIAEIVFLVFCGHYKLDPNDPTKRRSPVKLKAVS